MSNNNNADPPLKNATTASAKSCEPKGPALGARAAYARRRIKLLVVEDSSVVREQLAKLITKNETIELVGCAENGLQGCQMFVALRPDVVLLDLRLPGLSGFDLIRLFRRERPDCVVIVLTTFADDAIRARCLNLGADYFFDKVTQLDQVFELLNPRKANFVTQQANARILAAPPR